MRPLLALTLTSTLSACGGGSGASSFGSVTQPGASTAPAESGESTAGSSGSVGDGTSSTSSTSSKGASSSSDGMVWDMGIPDFGPQQPAGCEGKIDFLFVISAEGSMEPFQERLIASFPGFMDAIHQQLPNFDVHILSANPNPGWKIGDCSVCTTDCDPQGVPPYCGAMLTACDKKTGAGVTFPAGTAATNRRCEIDDGRRYITSGQPDMDEVFGCIAQLGVGGTGRSAQGMVAALQPEINDPDDEEACNRGFLRDEALLVVTLIQDSYDQDSLGTVDEWLETLRAAKHYDDDAFAVLVLTTDVDLGFDQLCLPEESNPNPNRLRTLADGVEHGFVGSICLPSYVDFFAEHVAVLVDLCEDFVPPG